MGPAALASVSSTSEIAAASGGRMVSAVTLAAGSGAAATAVLRTGGGSGTVLLTLAAPQGDTAHAAFPCGVSFHSGVHVTLSGAGAVCSVAYV